MTTEAAQDPAWLNIMHRLLAPSCRPRYSVVDLFCGAGGLSLGFVASGFRAYGIDYNSDAVDTFGANVGSAQCLKLNDDTVLPRAEVVVAGPPCQPWSRAGKRRGVLDAREGLSLVTRAIEKAEPVVAVVENVADMSRGDGRRRLDRLVQELSRFGYSVRVSVLNAADFGVPQNRRRTFVIAVRGDQPIELPSTWDRRYSARDAIGESCHRITSCSRFLSKEMDQYIARYEKASGCRTPRDLHLEKPARTLTVRNLSGATGDMMRLSLPNGRRRMLTVREAARLQSFPDWFRFFGSRSSQLTQIGNAVPPLLGLAIAKQVRQRLMAWS